MILPTSDPNLSSLSELNEDLPLIGVVSSQVDAHLLQHPEVVAVHLHSTIQLYPFNLLNKVTRLGY